MEVTGESHRLETHIPPGNTSSLLANSSDSVLITPSKNFNGGKLYRAVLSEDEYGLQEEVLEQEVLQLIPSNSHLSLNPEHLARLRSAHIYVIVSRKSGAGLAVSAYENVLCPLAQLFGIETKVHTTSSKTSHKEFLATAAFSPDNENIIVVLGGDTMIYDLLNALPDNRHLTASHRITVSPIPCGTGNALAMSLGITSIPIGISTFFGVSQTRVVQTSPLPVLRIVIRSKDREQVKWAAVVCSWGLHASLVADSDDPEMRRQYGPKRFGVAAERLLTPSPHIYHGDVRISGQSTLGNQHSYLLLSHVSHLEPTFPIAPKQSPLSSTISVIQIGPMTGEGLMGVMQAVYNNSSHFTMEDVEFIEEVKEVEFVINEEDERWRRICIDGDIVIVDQSSIISVRVCDGVLVRDETLQVSVTSCSQ